MNISYNKVYPILKSFAKSMGNYKVIDIENEGLEIVFGKSHKNIQKILIDTFTQTNPYWKNSQFDVNNLRDNVGAFDEFMDDETKFVKGKYVSAISSLDHSAQYPAFELCRLAFLFASKQSNVYETLAMSVITMHNEAIDTGHYDANAKKIPKTFAKKMVPTLQQKLPISKDKIRNIKKYTQMLLKYIDTTMKK